MYMKKGKKVRTCQNMSGILGGSNAFNFLSFVAGVVTLIVNVNNNINNNNNNLNDNVSAHSSMTNYVNAVSVSVRFPELQHEQQQQRQCQC